MGSMILLFVTIFTITVASILTLRYIKYRKSNYEVASGNSFFQTVFDTGNYGEFLTYNYLEKLNGFNMIMTNIYLPKEDGTTTEADLIMIAETGIYVFESKNYSGWIFGDEKNKNWTQSFPNKKKYKFLNPIWQNKGHISALKLATEIENDEMYKSYIVFSKRCELKKIKIESSNVKVMKRTNLSRIIKKDIERSNKIMTQKEVYKLSRKLEKYTHATETVKKEHIENIKQKYHTGN